MKKILVILLLIVATTSFAQDIIILKDNTKVEAKITEVSSKTIKYLKYNNQSGPSFVLEISKISSILYQNGEVASFDVVDVDKDINNNTTIKNQITQTSVGDFMYNGKKVDS